MVCGPATWIMVGRPQMKSLTVVQDSREHKGYELPFPDHIKVHFRRSKKPITIKINTQVDTMPAGDYTLLGFDHIVLVETKRSAREVRDNLLTADFRRASNAFQKLSSSTHCPVLALEFSQADFGKLGDDSAPCMDALAWATARYGLSIWFAGPRSAALARRRTAECLLRLMIAYVQLEYPNFLDGEGINTDGTKKRK